MDISTTIQTIFEPELQEEILKIGKLKKVKENEVIIAFGQEIHYMPIVLKGTVKVSMTDDNGKEFLMYYLNASESCAMTFSCCMEEKTSEIQAVAEKDAELWMIPVQYLDIWMAKYSGWRSFVMRTMQNRFYEMLKIVDRITFNSLDMRLLEYLKSKSLNTGKTIINVSHEEIATDLASSRVVISRLLKKLENDGRVLLYRNQIKLLKDF